MADVYTFNQEGMRKLVNDHLAQKRDMSNLKRMLAHYATRRHEAVYIPAAKPKFHNASGEEIPAYAVMRIESVDDDDLHEVNKPNDDFKCRYLVNLGNAVPIDGNGTGTWLEQSDKVLYDSGTPAIDEEWGAKDGQWSLHVNRPGFLITGGVEADDTIVRAKQRVVTDLIGKPVSDIASGASGDVTMWMGPDGSEVAVEYVFACRAKYAAVTADKGCVVFLRNGVWYVGPWEC